MFQYNSLIMTEEINVIVLNMPGVSDNVFTIRKIQEITQRLNIYTSPILLVCIKAYLAFVPPPHLDKLPFRVE